LALLSLLTLITSADALPFVYQAGDLCLGFRKTGSTPGLYEVVVDVGPVTNYLALPAGVSTNITAYTPSQLSPDSWASLTNLSWSVTGYTLSSTLFPGYSLNTLWVTVPRVGGVSGPVPQRQKSTRQANAVNTIESIFIGAASQSSGMASNQDNTASCVREVIASDDFNEYSDWIADETYPAIGDLNDFAPSSPAGSPINLEDTTPTPSFTTAVQSDLYQVCPANTTDPNSGTTSGGGYNVGYFTLNPSGSMTFTRASTAVAPVAGFTVSPTNGFAPLNVVFTDASTGTITTWIWTFGDGQSVTNSSNANVNHTYASAGTYSVSLTDNGPGGANTATENNYIVAYPRPQLTAPTRSGNSFMFGGSGCPVGVQYRILCSTNLLGAWAPIVTNNFSTGGTFSFTGGGTNATAYFRLVSP